jgi:geranylgeranyl reductase family protein
MEPFDVAIVGAGPAGSHAAWKLARAGARVALVDDSHPREKPCGGGITGRALHMLRHSIALDAVDANAIHGTSFENGPQRARIGFDPPSSVPELVVVSRVQFDSALLDAARAAGANHIPARVIDVTKTASGWELTTRTIAVRARWVLGADGANSLIRRRLSQPFPRADLSIATGFFVHGVSSADIAIAFEEHPRGYLWSFPRRDHLAVGVCAQADEASTASLIPLASAWISSNVPSALRLQRYSWPIPSLPESAARRENPAGPGWMLLGDAAGMVDPITREGIFFAVLSAEIAADSLMEGRGDPAARYRNQVRATIFDELARAARFKARFFDPRFTRLLLRALESHASIRSIMVDLVAGRQGYRGLRRRLLATMEVRLMFDLLMR